jgi:hypothetical protein
MKNDTAMATAQRQYDNATPPEAPDVHGEVEIELDGVTFDGFLPSADDKLEVFCIYTSNETLCFGGLSNIPKHRAACEAVLKATHNGERLRERLKEIAVRMLRGEVRL